MSSKGKIQVFGWASIGILSFALIEIFSFVFIYYSQSRVAYFGGENYSQKEFENYKKARNSFLGWLPKHRSSRPSPANEKYENASWSLSVYGDSYAYSDEVKDSLSWSNRLAQRLQRPVLNFAVPAYGVDQAVMRFERNEDDPSEVVILSISSVNVVRNATQNFSLPIFSGAYGVDYLKFSKPRFVVNGQDELKIEPIPIDQYEDYLKLKEKPSEVYQHESFLPGTLYGRVKVDFPYSLSLFEVLKKSRVLRESASIGEDHFTTPFPWLRDENLLSLNKRIVSRFFDICEKRNKTCRILIIPEMVHFIERFLDEKKVMTSSIYKNAPWADKVWDSTPWVSKQMKKPFPCYYIGKQRDCGGHYNADGYQIVAQYVETKINNLLAHPL